MAFNVENAIQELKDLLAKENITPREIYEEQLESDAGMDINGVYSIQICPYEDNPFNLDRWTTDNKMESVCQVKTAEELVKCFISELKTQE